MSSKVAKLIAAFRQHLTVPWQPGLAAIQRVIFAVYDKNDELRLRANVEEFALVTRESGKSWLLIDVTDAFPTWMSGQEYREAYFESPEDLAVDGDDQRHHSIGCLEGTQMRSRGHAGHGGVEVRHPNQARTIQQQPGGQLEAVRGR